MEKISRKRTSISYRSLPFATWKKAKTVYKSRMRRLCLIFAYSVIATVLVGGLASVYNAIASIIEKSDSSQLELTNTVFSEVSGSLPVWLVLLVASLLLLLIGIRTLWKKTTKNDNSKKILTVGIAVCLTLTAVSVLLRPASSLTIETPRDSGSLAVVESNERTSFIDSSLNSDRQNSSPDSAVEIEASSLQTSNCSDGICQTQNAQNRTDISIQNSNTNSPDYNNANQNSFSIGGNVDATITTSEQQSGVNALFPYPDLSKANLSYISLAGTKLIAANLSEVNLTGTDLSNANLANTNLSDADLSEATLTGAILINADLSRANLSNVSLSGADLGRSNLTSASFVNVDFRNVQNITKEQLDSSLICRVVLPEAIRLNPDRDC